MVQTIVTSTVKQTEQHVEKFGRFENQTSSPSWVFPLRKAGMARFAELGFPTTRDEDWRFTNVNPIARLPFRPAFEATKETLTLDDIPSFAFSELGAFRLVFVNGHFSPDLSSAGDPGSGVVATSLAKALAANLPMLEKHLGRYAGHGRQPFTALNTAFFQDGAFVCVPKGVQFERPIHILCISTSKESGTTYSPRNLLVAEEGSQVTVIESYHSTRSAAYLTNAVTELIAGDRAVVEHCKFQDESVAAYHVAALHVEAGAGSNVVSHSISAGGRIARNNIRTVLAGEGLECMLNGLYLTRGDQLADHHMVVEHAQPHCASHEYFNGILDERSKAVFHGRILVRQAAQKTDAKQTNKNLLLSADATVDTKPQLEIYADDVKCTHGATIGQLNEDSIFYLRARGIGTETARRMLIHAFAGEIIERIRHRPLRDALDKLIWDRLEANPHLAGHQ